jgi:hypothetical protein
MNYSYFDTYILYNKTLIYWDLGNAVVFCGPSTAVVALGFASGNNGGLGSTKHTVSLGLSK